MTGTVHRSSMDSPHHGTIDIVPAQPDVLPAQPYVIPVQRYVIPAQPGMTGVRMTGNIGRPSVQAGLDDIGYPTHFSGLRLRCRTTRGFECPR